MHQILLCLLYYLIDTILWRVRKSNEENDVIWKSHLLLLYHWNSIIKVLWQLIAQVLVFIYEKFFADFSLFNLYVMIISWSFRYFYFLSSLFPACCQILNTDLNTSAIWYFSGSLLHLSLSEHIIVMHDKTVC